MLRPDPHQTSPLLIVGRVERHNYLRPGVVDQVDVRRRLDHGGKSRPRPRDGAVGRGRVLEGLLQIVGLEAGQLPFDDGFRLGRRRDRVGWAVEGIGAGIVRQQQNKTDQKNNLAQERKKDTPTGGAEMVGFPRCGGIVHWVRYY